MKIEKMHGCGNDFCVLEYKDQIDYSQLAIKVCNRKTGIGGDGMIVVKNNPLEMIFYNADGSRAPMCGNGIRCFAKYCFDHALVKQKKLDVLTQAGKKTIEIITDDPFMCKVHMGMPLFQNSLLHIKDDLPSFGRILKLKERNITVYTLFMGTVHTVLFVPDLNSELLNSAEEICNHPLFTQKTNVNFVQVVNRKTIQVKTYERGVGWTLACGTGCCASVVTTSKLGFTDPTVQVLLNLGHLTVHVTDKGVEMIGPATKVFECEYNE